MIIVSILYYFTVVVVELYVLYTEEQRAAALKSAAGRKSNRKLEGAGAGSQRASLPQSLAAGGLAKGSIYDRVGGSRSSSGGGPGGFNTGALDQSFNPMAIASARSDGGGLGLDAGAMSVVDNVGGMNAPPPPEVWRVVQATLKDMHQQLVEAKIREAELMALQASQGDSMGPSPTKTAFAPQALGGGDGAPSPGRGAGGATGGLQAFKSNMRR